MLVPELFQPFVMRLEDLGVPYMVTGSVAGILYGEPRMTHDVDIVVELAPGDGARIEAAFSLDEFYCPPRDVIEIEARRRQRGHFNLIHHATGFKADLYLAFDDLHRWALARRRVISLGSTNVAIAPLEYVILRKLEYFREGGSEKHLRDIRAMLEISSELIDRALVSQKAAKSGLRELWDLAQLGS